MLFSTTDNSFIIMQKFYKISTT